MIAPRDELARRIDAALEEVESRGPIKSCRMSSSRVHSSFTGAPDRLRDRTRTRRCSRCRGVARNRRRIRSMCMMISRRLSPSVFIVELRAAFGFWRRRPDFELAVLEPTPSSSAARAARARGTGRGTAPSAIFAAPRSPHRRRRRCAAHRAGACFDSSAASREPALLSEAVGALVPRDLELLRAVCACHHVSATIATPRSSPPRSVPPSTTNACLTPGIALI